VCVLCVLRVRFVCVLFFVVWRVWCVFEHLFHNHALVGVVYEAHVEEYANFDGRICDRTLAPPPGVHVTDSALSSYNLRVCVFVCARVCACVRQLTEVCEMPASCVVEQVCEKGQVPVVHEIFVVREVCEEFGVCDVSDVSGAKCEKSKRH